MKKILRVILFELLLMMFILPVSASTLSEKNINVNSWYSDSLTSSTVANKYTFQLNQAGYVSIAFKHDIIDSGNRYWRAEICNDNGDMLLQRDFVGNIAELETAQIGLPAGTYYITVQKHGTFTSNMYQFRLNYTSSDSWEKEANDTTATATLISVNKEMYGCIAADSKDVDRYKFSLNQNGYVSITFNHEYLDSTANYWRLQIYNNNGDVLLQEDFDGDKVETETAKVGLIPGTYYIKINDISYSDITYQFRLNFTPSESWEKEVNDTTTAANIISVNKNVYGSTVSDEDIDCYQFTLNSAADVSVVFEHDYIDTWVTKWRFYIYTNNGNDLLEGIVHGDEATIESEKINLPAGTYYFQVYGFSTNTYNFCIKTSSGSLPYGDVSGNDWFYDAAAYCYQNDLMTGLTDTVFAPYQPLVRAQFAGILHRMNGEPSVSFSKKFPDVSNGTWYTNAVMWASNKGIISGYSNGMFGPADMITREQMAVMMYNYARVENYNTSIKGDLNKFYDGHSVSAYAKEAVRWAVGNGILSGKDNGTRLDPWGNASRAECATIIMNFTQKYGI